MGKLFSWVLIAFAIYVAYKVMLALQRKSALRESGRDPNKGTGDGAGKTGQTGKTDKTGRNPAAGGALVQLVSCAHCGLQLPREEAVSREPRYFCGEAHARLGAAERDGL